MKFSVITIALNVRAALQQTIASVNAQAFADFEHVIVDGGSDDGSQEMFLRECRRLGDWVSEKDGGISAAFNRGTELSKGEWVCYLNAGDVFASDDVLEKVAMAIEQSGASPAVYYGDYILEGADSRNVGITSAQPEKFAWTNPLNHQSVFLPRSLALEHRYDETLQLAMDYDLWLRLLPLVPFRKLEVLVAVFRTDGRSSDPRWAVHNLVMRRVLWHQSRRERIDFKALTVIYLRAVLLWGGLRARRLVGRKFVLWLKKKGGRDLPIKPVPAPLRTSNA